MKKTANPLDKTKAYPRLELMDVASLKAAPDPARAASAEDAHRLYKSQQLFGLLRPPVVVNARTGAVLDGGSMLQALASAGVKEVPCWVVYVDPGLEPLARMALQNHVAEWRWQEVSKVLNKAKEAGHDHGLAGFHEAESGPVMAADWTVPAKGSLDGDGTAQEMMML